MSEAAIHADYLAHVFSFLEGATGRKPKLAKSPKGKREIDAVFRFDDKLVFVEAKKNRDMQAISNASRQLRNMLAHTDSEAHPLLVVPYMTEAGAALCKNDGVNWIDLSGNADIRIPPYFIHVEGKPNQFPAGRTTDLFAPKSSRVVRAMLTQPDREWRNAELVEETRLGSGYVSRIMTSLEDAGVVEKTGRGRGRLLEAERTLLMWREAYQFSDHTVIEGHVHGSSEERLQKLAAACQKEKLGYAFSGLSAADHWTSMLTGYRLVSLFVDRKPSHKFFEGLSFESEPRGANTWIVIANDEYVFYRAAKDNAGRKFVSPLQTYLDLKAHPERASTVAEELRPLILT